MAQDQDDLPSFEEMAAQHDIDKTRITLTEEGDGWRAICSPCVDGEASHGAPFPIATVGDPPSYSELGDAFSEQFDRKVDEVYELIERSRDPIKEIEDADPADLVVVPEDE